MQDSLSDIVDATSVSFYLLQSLLRSLIPPRGIFVPWWNDDFYNRLAKPWHKSRNSFTQCGQPKMASSTFSIRHFFLLFPSLSHLFCQCRYLYLLTTFPALWPIMRVHGCADIYHVRYILYIIRVFTHT